MLKKRSSQPREPFQGNEHRSPHSRRKEVKMETRLFCKRWISPVISCSMLMWTAICFIGSWVVIIKYDILWKGFIAMVMTFFFAAGIWAIPFAGLTLLSLYVAPPKEQPYYAMFKDLIRKGMRRSSE